MEVVVSLLRVIRNNAGIFVDFGLGPTVVAKRADGSDVAVVPDFIGRYANLPQAQGLVIDTKWTLPKNRGGLVEELTAVRKYMGPLTGWPLKTSNVQSLDVVILCHLDNTTRVLEALTSLVRDDADAYGYLDQPGYSVWTWGEMVDSKGREVVRIAKIWGAVRHPELQKLLNDSIDIPKSQFLVEKTSFLFVGDKPPIGYVMLRIIQVVHANAFGFPPEREKVISVDDHLELFNRFFPPVSPNSGPQVGRRTLAAAVALLAGIGYNVRRLKDVQVGDLGLDAGKEWYRFQRKMPRGDLFRWICSQLQRHLRRLESRRRARTRLAMRKTSKMRQKGQKGLRDFGGG